MTLTSTRTILRSTLALVLALLVQVSVYAQTQRATGKPTVFKVTVTKVELFNGTSYVTVFTGSAQLDLVAAAGGSAFPGISGLTLPAGTYSKIRLTFSNSFGIQGSLPYLAATYYVTSTTINSNAAAVASTTAGSAGEATLLNPSWGVLGAAVTQEIDVAPISVGTGTPYQPTVKFDVSSALVLWEQLGQFFFTLAPITVTIV
jgi:hypothetical protein